MPEGRHAAGLATSQTTSCCPSRALPRVTPPPLPGCGDPAEGDGSNRRLADPWVPPSWRRSLPPQRRGVTHCHPPPAALPKLRAGAGEPPGFPEDPGTAGCSPGAAQGPAPGPPAATGRKTSAQSRNESRQHPHPRGDTGSSWPGARTPPGCKGTPRQT